MAKTTKTTTTSPIQVLTTPLSTHWWNTNLPPSDQTPTIPSYLLYATAHPKEQANLSTPDAIFTRQTWPQVRSLITANRLDQFTRVPSELRQYRRWTEEVYKEYGSMMAFILKEKLGWGEMDCGDSRVGEGRRFGWKENYTILPNDWPYGFDQRIMHLVVWTKFPFPSNPVTDDLLPASRAEIEGFVRETFTRVCGEENVVWFRNWGELKSVRAIEHFHVLLFDPGEGFVRGVVG